MIKYKSTRGDKNTYTFSEAIIKGIANDGGLFVPERIPHVTPAQLKQQLGKSYQQRADFLLNHFETDFSKNTITRLVANAYGTNFDDVQIAPVVKLADKQFVLELWHGQTLAFKDMALQLMPLFFAEAVKKKSLHYLILVATSGDTGKAALEGYKNKKNISIIVFYPYGRVSQFQEKQMVTQDGNNVSVVAVDGDFDDCQHCVKEVFADITFGNELLTKSKTVLSSANSINWGRLLPQIIYFFHGYLELVKKGAISLGAEIDVVVPTGNFGNILAAYYAKKMGLPIKTCICASNTNNVLTEFLQTGVYDITKRSLIKTPSPSMDILIASNIERLLYLLTEDAKKVSKWMHELKTKKRFAVDEKTKKIVKSLFRADWVSNEDCLANIKNVYEKTNYLLDPHTSVAQLVAQRTNAKRPVLIASTAHWVKFASDVYTAIAGDKAIQPKDEFATAEAICRLVPQAKLPQQMLKLRNKKTKYAARIAATKLAVEEVIQKTLSFA